ncbi:protein unc-13 homolog 4B isoform X1 [Drosophila persimilis]|uniref:protein unc-13 homolog 4B isoform X1 n=1 Tax=Drosophila persimilis TaxID=7234 RepID=UPI000F08AC8D|nr:protein unc-13 homolog 4B isoform X1 [Drosophila persimilis]XP_026840157.1 protein unc-13 homolog 4B isoform X1 [Drosophila persimilis]
MDEEQMWKGFFLKLHELKMNPPTEHEYQLQDGDGGFFEKFGSLLRQKSQLNENILRTPLSSLKEDIQIEENELIIEKPNHADPIDTFVEEILPPWAPTNDIGDTVFDSGTVMNVEDLYEEILFEIYNNIGCENNEGRIESLVGFAQDAFKIPNSTHLEISEVAVRKEPPNVRLNIEIIKAENLLSKDSNGLSDPFVTLYLESRNSHRYNSSVKPATLNPIWEEHFSLPITENPREEVLIVEVWDFDAAETIKEKVNKLLDVKGVKGLSKLMKEIAVTASSGKHDNELIGRAAITLKSIPVSGLTVWYNLEKGNKARSRGSILVNLTLSAEKNKSVAVQEHKNLLKLLLMYELESSQVAFYWWSGKFSENAEIIRSQHAVQSGLTPIDCAISQWHAYSIIHETHKLNFSLFNSILDVLTPVISCMQKDSEDLATYWDGVRRILPSCFAVLRKIRYKNVSDLNITRAVSEVLDILGKVKLFEVPVTIDIFPTSVYGWIHRNDGKNICNVDSAIIDAINTGTKEWLEHIVEGSKYSKDNETDEEKLQYIIKLIQMIRSDLQRAMEYFDKLFYHKIQLNYSAILYLLYDSKLNEICEPIVKDVCNNIKRLDVPDDQFEYLPKIDNLNMGTTLFELYLVLKRYVQLGKSLCTDELKMSGFYQWFETGVTHWLDISIIKALNRIQKAIDLDQLKAVDETVKYSSSAVDTLSIFYQIKIFWQQLDWPEVEGCYTFIAKIVNDLCRCCIFYAQRMSQRVEKLTKLGDNNKIFILSEEWCLAINNMDYIRQSLPSFIKELGIDNVIQKLGEYRTNLEADRCSSTINAVIENALDTERNQIVELIEIVSHKMAPPMKLYLAEGAEVLHKDSNSMDQLMMYLESSLDTLYNTLNEVNFGRILESIWSELSIILYDLIQSNLDKRRPPAYFKNLKDTLQTMIYCFKMGNVATDVNILSTIQKRLDAYALETADLIHQYYIERLEYQKNQPLSPFGQLTIRAEFTDSSLLLTILNARNLLPMDSNGFVDSFTKACFMPTSRFNGISPVKTTVHHKSCFPLYDQEFCINLNEQQRTAEDSLILFSVKDKDLFGMSSQYIGECYASFTDLMESEGKQIIMNLSRPEYTDSETLRALEFRQGDKQAKDFIKKLKNKSYS